jgi:hypothetical protein
MVAGSVPPFKFDRLNPVIVRIAAGFAPLSNPVSKKMVAGSVPPFKFNSLNPVIIRIAAGFAPLSNPVINTTVAGSAPPLPSRTSPLKEHGSFVLANSGLLSFCVEEDIICLAVSHALWRLQKAVLSQFLL